MVYKLLYYQGAASQVTAVTVTNVKHSAQLVNLVNIGGVSQSNCKATSGSMRSRFSRSAHPQMNAICTASSEPRKTNRQGHVQ